MDLPPCRHRGQEAAPGSDLYACASAYLVPLGAERTGEFCRLYCNVKDHPNPGQLVTLPTPVPPAEMPGFLQRAANFAGAVVRHAADGGKHVSEDEYQRRLAICHACPYLVGNTCQQCGCPVAGDVIAKARWASESCPVKKWLAVE